MPTSLFTFFYAFKEAMAEKKHNLGSDTLVWALTNSAPNAATYDELADITQIAYTYCSSRTATVSSSSLDGATYKLIIADLTLTASGGNVGPFRYAVLYNDTAANDDLIGYYDYGSSITLASGEDLLLDLPAGGVVNLT